MEQMTVTEIIEASGGRLIKGNPQLTVPGISINSRTLREGELFLALKGQRFDGHDFVEEALRKGASGAIISNGLRVTGYGSRVTGHESRVVIQVSDTLKALQDIAHRHRRKFDIPLIAITGTNGKTTTKDMVAGILSRKLKVLKAEGSFNNEVGIPLTLLQLSPFHQAAVLEVGMNAPGEIAHLVRLIDPRVGAITNIGRAHLEFFADIEEIARAKGELVEALEKEGTLILNRDDQRVRALSRRFEGRLMSFGIKNKSDFQALDIRYLPDGRAKFILTTLGGRGENREVELPLPGYANIYNALAAAAISATFNLDLDLIKEGLENFKPSPMRMEVTSRGGVRVINDAYNANPESMRMALEVLNRLPVKGKKVAVLGDMLELGKWSEEAHREVGKLIASSPPDILIAVGYLSRFVAEEAGRDTLKGKIFTFADSREAGKRLAELIENGDTILIKGSRAMRMEEVVNVLSSLS